MIDMSIDNYLADFSIEYHRRFSTYMGVYESSEVILMAIEEDLSQFISDRLLSMGEVIDITVSILENIKYIVNTSHKDDFKVFYNDLVSLLEFTIEDSAHYEFYEVCGNLTKCLKYIKKIDITI